MPTQLKRLHTLIVRGLDNTAALWPDIQVAYEWVHRAAHLLANQEGLATEETRRQYKGLLAQMKMRADQQSPGPGPASMRQWVDYFLKVTDSYWAGLFHCYDTPDLPQTNNDLEQCFGSARHHERRATGRKQTSATVVVRGSVRLVAAVGTMAQVNMQGEGFRVQDLRLANPEQCKEWKQLRTHLEYRQASRRAQFRFRRDPHLYLSHLEALLLKSTLPF